MTTVEVENTFEKIETNLIQFNQEIVEENIAVRAFYIEDDDELEGIVAHVVFVVDDGDVPESLEILDKYCERVGEKLIANVVFTYCIYRTSEEYDEDFKNEEWENILYEVNNAADPS